MKHTGELTGRAALITGAAGAIGRAVTRGFLREGIRCLLLDNHADRLNQFAEELSSTQTHSHFVPVRADVRSSEQVHRAFQRALDEFGRLDILLNNAAVTQIKTIDDITDEDIDLLIDTNLKGYIKCAREAVKIMKKLGTRGSILFVSSKNGLVGASEKSLYCSTKGGEINLARSLALELGQFGIRVNTICPDAVTEGSALWERGAGYIERTAKRYNISVEQIPDYYRNRSALKVNVTPEDVSETALFLVSERSAKLTGNILTVDGGVAFVR